MATFHPCFGQKKRQLNTPLWHLLTSTNSLRGSARLLRINRKTVSRKLKFLGFEGRLEHARFLAERVQERGPFRNIQFDEMETLEHTKCKPISIPLVVERGTRLILGIGACSMPAKGLLVEKAREKYAFRVDHRRATILSVLTGITPHLAENTLITSDSNPHYPSLIRLGLPGCRHSQIQGRRSSIGGQGELKKTGWDPIFALNHTAASLRANVSRLIRKTWCTTKKVSALEDHLTLYAVRHNREIVAKERRKSALDARRLASVAA